MDWDTDWEENHDCFEDPKEPPKIVMGNERDKKIEELKQLNNRYDIVQKTIDELKNERYNLYYRIKRLEYVTQHLDRCEKCIRWRNGINGGDCPRRVDNNNCNPIRKETERNGCIDFIKCSWS